MLYPASTPHHPAPPPQNIRECSRVFSQTPLVDILRVFCGGGVNYPPPQNTRRMSTSGVWENTREHSRIFGGGRGGGGCWQSTAWDMVSSDFLHTQLSLGFFLCPIIWQFCKNSLFQKKAFFFLNFSFLSLIFENYLFLMLAKTL